MVYSLVHLFIFLSKSFAKLGIEHRVNFAKRSRTKGNTTNGNNNDNVHVETIERHSAITNRTGQTSIKESTTHSIKQAGQWLTSGALIALGHVNIINSVCEIQVVSDPH